LSCGWVRERSQKKASGQKKQSRPTQREHGVQNKCCQPIERLLRLREEKKWSKMPPVALFQQAVLSAATSLQFAACSARSPTTYINAVSTKLQSIHRYKEYATAKQKNTLPQNKPR
jgi:hypothetical protein